MTPRSNVDPNFGLVPRNILVSVDTDLDMDRRLGLVADLADRFSCHVIGAGAREVVMPVLTEADVIVQTDLLEEERRIVQRDLDDAETVFRRTFDRSTTATWLSATDRASYYICEQARSADLVVCGARLAEGTLGGALRVDPGHILLGLGRPLLVVPPRTEMLVAKRIVIGWKNSREARRAIVDALPFLQRSENVLVVCAGGYPDIDGAKAVAEHLRRYGIQCEGVADTPSSSRSVAEDLRNAVTRSGSDLLVCGAYGHTRLREWVFGGVTTDLLDDTRSVCLLSH